ncbi:MAG: ATP F0F1 synthase subunit B [Rhodospirillaceae bacterium]|jgi:F-type H+-transporting ATPase subunit b|nr:ATP F0F1 synthase subunit B [Rhodospirillaceae bacterium]MBT3909842.1 ATP F0F1 synthase subunit B [Rhodospirillaceae bacterium]MBT5299500.1 ATP F0F1 synthase subunit B [Rhodospirillaceae bacterium]MBT5515688.1 ATP F0F1 synthase subunit B [Rhodospirillaceae bacterium]MBT6087755.1 ATP F0F1 synthase subunit B [Rhodospirillaceae bacterium]
MFHDPTFWVLVSFTMFIGVLVYLKVPGMITGALDKRAEKIKADIDEAEKLLEEAQDLLATYQKKQREASDVAQEIKAKAKEEAERLKVHGRERMEDALARREKLAIERIAQAEAAAVDEIRTRTVDIAMDATRELLASKLSDGKAEAMVDDAIKELPNRLN